MALIFDNNKVPDHWARRPQSLAGARGRVHPSVEIALINNMPDAALEDTESQFFQLLEAAGCEIPIRITLYSLPNLPRGERALQYLNSFYYPVDDLWNRRLDALIVTGTEPRQPNLRNEPYWPAMVDVLDWAEHNTTSTILSCLAAHAGVLYSDGIEREPLSEKQFGVFDYRKVSNHALTLGAPELIRFPHSRWNEVRGDALTACGYSVLTESAQAGVDLFVKTKGKGLFVHFQGHPEYEANTLLKEYRRDVRRFFKQERETYPSIPEGYFTPQMSTLFASFRESALKAPTEELLAQFPDVTPELNRSWRVSAESIYNNWLHYLVSRGADNSEFAGATQVGPNSRRRVRDNGVA